MKSVLLCIKCAKFLIPIDTSVPWPPTAWPGYFNHWCTATFKLFVATLESNLRVQPPSSLYFVRLHAISGRLVRQRGDRPPGCTCWRHVDQGGWCLWLEPVRRIFTVEMVHFDAFSMAKRLQWNWHSPNPCQIPLRWWRNDGQMYQDWCSKLFSTVVSAKFVRNNRECLRVVNCKSRMQITRNHHNHNIVERTVTNDNFTANVKCHTEAACTLITTSRNV